MSTSTDRIDQLALVWLLVPRQKSLVTDFAKQLRHVAKGADDAKRLARESIARLQGSGMLEKGRKLDISEAGRRRALEWLGASGLPAKSPLQWAKRTLLLRSLDVAPTNAAVNTAGTADVLAARILARRHKLDRRIEGDVSKVLAVLARRAVGLEEKDSFDFNEVFPAIFLADTKAAEPDEDSAPISATTSLRLEERDLRDFARIVADAARSSATGRWHGAVFISHVWNTLRAQGNVGITFERFKRRLIEAYQSDLVELSRADLVEAMPAADVSASETIHSGARFHFVRLEQLAS